jgi:hypothetical protein
VAGFCISHQPLQIRPAHLLKPQMQPTWRALTRAARFPAAHWRILRHIEARWRSSPP